MAAGLKVLLVEDSETDAKLVAHELRKSLGAVETERVDGPAGLRAALSRDGWDVVISDWFMPNLAALEALSVTREVDLDLPFIIVSGSVDEEDAVDAMRAGANDYVRKDNLTRLAPAVEREVRESRSRRARRAAETALRRTTARLNRLSESGIVGIIVTDGPGHVIEANDAYLEMLGYTRDEFLSGEIAWAASTPPEWREADEAATRMLETTGVEHPREKELFRKDGSRADVLVGGAALEYPECIKLVADLSARKKIEEALASSQEQLRQAQKMEAVGRLAGGVAHDFNNLLSVILSYTEMGIRNLPPGEPLRADLEEIKAAGERAAALTTQLLALSRRQVLEPRVVDLNALVAATSKLLGRLIGEDVKLTFKPGPELGAVLADPGQIDQVLMNLAVNARDAMPQGGELTLETANASLDEEDARSHLGVEPGRYVLLAVSDTGIGMDQALQSRVFEPFFTTKEKGKGTGLGLSTVFGIIHQSRGHIWIDSEPGHGTTFEMYLPRTDRVVEPVMAPEDRLSTLNGTETILLVEDEEQIRNVVHGLLRNFGYRILEAKDGAEALLVAEQHKGRIDLLLTDLVMPVMGGTELAKRLCAVRHDLKVLCMSGYTEEAGPQYGTLEAGFAFLQKPITPDKLARKIRAVLGADKPARSAEAKGATLAQQL